jgi:hypothetical protein
MKTARLHGDQNCAEFSRVLPFAELGKRLTALFSSCSTQGARVLTAIHSFLRFQIQDHRTGDSLEGKK